jgi:hypothetical protein
MSSSEIQDLLAGLGSGQLTLTQVAARFRAMSWPRTRRPEPRDDAERAEQADPAPEVPGSFDDVLAAYERGELDRVQYRTLVEAAAESVRAEVQRRREM